MSPIILNQTQKADDEHYKARNRSYRRAGMLLFALGAGASLLVLIGMWSYSGMRFPDHLFRKWSEPGIFTIYWPCIVWAGVATIGVLMIRTHPRKP